MQKQDKRIIVDNNMIDVSSLSDKFTDEGYLFYGIDITKEKEFKNFIRASEAMCRKTQEYLVWQRRTKMLAVNQNSDPDKDDSSICPICNMGYQYVDAETHHHPITLFNLLINQFQDWIDDNELDDRAPLDLVQEVMGSHLAGFVEHVVICKHCHEKYHNRYEPVKEILDKIIEYKRELKKETLSETMKEEHLKKQKIYEDIAKEKAENRAKLADDFNVIESKSEVLSDINKLLDNL